MPAVTITITLDENGGVNINGPLENRVVLYGILLTAMDIVQEWNKSRENKIQPVSLMPPVKFPGS